MCGNRCWEKDYRSLRFDWAGQPETGRGGSAIRKQRWRLRSIAGMAEGESLYRGRHGEHRIVLETGIQHFGRTSPGDPGQSGAGQSPSRQEDGSYRLPMVSGSVTAWVGSTEFYSSTRYPRIAGSARRRRTLLQNGTQERNRVQKVLEDANVKIGNVLSDVFGMSGQAMLEALLENKLSPEQVADLARGSLRRKIPQIVEALEGHRMSEHHRLLIRQAFKHMQFIEEMIEELDKQIQEKLAAYQKQVELACSVPGIRSDAAAGILAEIGMDMGENGPFPSCHHLASWAGVCPGNNSSAGKRKSGKIRKGNRWLKATLRQTAWAGANTKNSAFQFRYQRLKTRRGVKRATIAVAHAQLIALYWVLRSGVPYQQQRQDLEQQQRESLIRHHLHRLAQLGYTA